MMAAMDALAPLFVAKAAWLVLCGGHRLAHVHAGLAIYASAQLVWTQRAALKGLTTVALAMLANEALAVLMTGTWSVEARLEPALLTMAWPAGFFALWHMRRWRWAETQLRRDRDVEVPAPQPPAPRLRLVRSSPATARPAPISQRPATPPRLRVFPGLARPR